MGTPPDTVTVVLLMLLPGAVTQAHLAMPHRLKVPLVDARLCLARTLISLLRNAHTAWRPDHAFAADIDSTLIITAIFLGHAEGRPFSSSKLAGYLDMPRTTLLRRLELLEREGAIVHNGHHYLLNIDAAVMQDKVRATRRAIAINQDAAQRLSKLDTELLVN